MDVCKKIKNKYLIIIVLFLSFFKLNKIEQQSR